RHRQDFIAMLDTGRTFDLYTEQKFALGVEWPGLGALEILCLVKAPDRSGSRLRAAAAGADAELVGANFVVREPAGAHELLHRICVLRLAQQDAVHAASQDLAELPGVEGDVRAVDAVD